LFTQEQVNDIVRDRLEREKVKLSEEMNSLKVKAGETEEIKKVLDAYRKNVAAMLTERKKGITPAVAKLLEKLDPLEQLTWLAENTDQTSKPLPIIPKPEHTAPGTDEQLAAKARANNYSI
jgi:hypothetical protein